MRKIGNSLGLILPARVMKEAGFGVGERVSVIASGPGELRIVRVEEPQPDLTEAQVDAGRRFMAKFRRDFEILADS